MEYIYHIYIILYTINNYIVESLNSVKLMIKIKQWLFYGMCTELGLVSSRDRES